MHAARSTGTGGLQPDRNASAHALGNRREVFAREFLNAKLRVRFSAAAAGSASLQAGHCTLIDGEATPSEISVRRTNLGHASDASSPR